ncbi:MAG: GatB/YqeY domain-containing protein [Candidatus Omnitrophota bacterium]
MLEEKITFDYREAMKARDQVKTQTLSFLRSELKYGAIEKKTDQLEDPDVLVVIKRLIKQRQDSITQFEKGQRMDLVAKEKQELETLKSYLPQQLSESQVSVIVGEVISSTQATGLKEMGKVMKEVMARTQGKADNKLVSDLVRRALEAKAQ